MAIEPSNAELLTKLDSNYQSPIWIDNRDGEQYKTVIINNKNWLAENLRYKIKGCYSPGRNKDNVKKYGYLYNWETAIKVCPFGWHLPSREEFKEFLAYWLKQSNSACEHFNAGLFYYRHYCFCGDFAFFWAREESDKYNAYACWDLSLQPKNKLAAFSVVLVKD